MGVPDNALRAFDPGVSLKTPKVLAHKFPVCFRDHFFKVMARFPIARSGVRVLLLYPAPLALFFANVLNQYNIHKRGCLPLNSPGLPECAIASILPIASCAIREKENKPSFTYLSLSRFTSNLFFSSCSVLVCLRCTVHPSINTDLLC